MGTNLWNSYGDTLYHVLSWLYSVDLRFSPLHFAFFFLVPCLGFGAILQGSLFGLAGLLPASYTAPIMSGQGFAGTFAAFSMICAIASAFSFVLMADYFVVWALFFLHSRSWLFGLVILMFPGGSAIQDSAFGYFITACVVIVLAIVSYVALPKMVRPEFY